MAEKKPNNPFLVSGYHSKEYFCDREEETNILRSALHNERSVLLVSSRRMGKTALISHLFHTIPSKEAYCIYTDLYRTTCMKDFVEALGKAVMGNCGSASARERLMQALQSLKFTFSVDAITGVPEIGVSTISPDATVSLAQIFNYVESADKPVYIAFDEFQQIENYPEKNAEKILRSYIQHLRNTFCIYSGSKKHVMTDMFSSAKRAFYQSAQPMQIEPIAEETYFEFCKNHFAKHGQTLNVDAFHFMYENLFAHTWYIQSTCSRLYETGTKEITIEDVRSAILYLVNINSFSYQNYCRLLTQRQLKLLTAIASERIVTEPTKHSFISKYDLGAASTISSALKQLIDNEFVYEENKQYSVYDRFFGIWLALS